MCIGSQPSAPPPPAPVAPVAPLEPPKPMGLADDKNKRSNMGLSQLRISNRSGGL